MRTNMKIYRLITSFLIILLSFNIVYSQVLNLPFPEKVSDVSFSHDGQYIAGSVASSSKGETVFLWEVSGGLIKTLKESITNFTISCLDISPDDQYILIGGRVEMGRITMWEIQNGNTRNFYNVPSLDPVNCLSYRPDGKYFVAGTNDKIIPVWSIESSKSIRTLKGHSKSVLTTVFDHDGKFLYSGSKDKEIIQWDFETGENARTLIGHNSAVTSINISHDGNFLASGSDDGIIYLWDLSTGNSIRTILAHKDPVTSICFSPDGKYIISSSEDESTKIFESSTGIFVRSYRHEDEINAVDISPDGKLIATASDDKSIKIWNSNIEIGSVAQRSNEKTTEPVNIASIPEIVWQVPDMAVDTSTRKDYIINAFIQSGNQLKSVSVYHNSLTRELDLTSYLANTSGEYNLNVEQNLILDNGNNSIIIKAVNDAGATTSEIRSVYYQIPVTIAGNEVVWETPSQENEITGIM